MDENRRLGDAKEVKDRRLEVPGSHAPIRTL
jgi:hypothetical protein